MSWFKLRIAVKPGVPKYQLREKKEEEIVHQIQFKSIASGFKTRMQVKVKADPTLKSIRTGAAFFKWNSLQI